IVNFAKHFAAGGADTEPYRNQDERNEDAEPGRYGRFLGGRSIPVLLHDTSLERFLIDRVIRKLSLFCRAPHGHAQVRGGRTWNAAMIRFGISRWSTFARRRDQTWSAAMVTFH